MHFFKVKMSELRRCTTCSKLVFDGL